LNLFSVIKFIFNYVKFTSSPNFIIFGKNELTFSLSVKFYDDDDLTIWLLVFLVISYLVLEVEEELAKEEYDEDEEEWEEDEFELLKEWVEVEVEGFITVVVVIVVVVVVITLFLSLNTFYY
jgi:Ca2+/Na+ antiporter